jgi:hypothetical protein
VRERRRDRSVSKPPSVLVEILDEEREASGCRRIEFEDSRQTGRSTAHRGAGPAAASWRDRQIKQ